MIIFKGYKSDVEADVEVDLHDVAVIEVYFAGFRNR